jgi:hypothetical protein
MKRFIKIFLPVVLLILLVGLCLDMSRLVLAPTREASIDAVRIRNAMVAELGRPAQSDWKPSGVPSDFNWERRPPTAYFVSVVERVASPEASRGSVLETAVQLARHLRETSRQGAPIQANTRETYEKIIGGEGGYCSDYTQSFNALALAAGLDVREWGFAWEDMANGHAFNEVWDPVLDKWIFIDSFVSFYVVDRSSGIPISALEFRDALLGEPGAAEIEVIQIVPERFGFNSVDRALNWYRRGVPRMFLVLGNNVYSYDSNPIIQATEVLPRSIEMVVAILLGEHPRFLFVPREADTEVVAQVEQMGWELAWVLVKLSAIILLAAALLVWVRHFLRLRRREARTT